MVMTGSFYCSELRSGIVTIALLLKWSAHLVTCYFPTSHLSWYVSCAVALYEDKLLPVIQIVAPHRRHCFHTTPCRPYFYGKISKPIFLGQRRIRTFPLDSNNSLLLNQQTQRCATIGTIVGTRRGFMSTCPAL